VSCPAEMLKRSELLSLKNSFTTRQKEPEQGQTLAVESSYHDSHLALVMRGKHSKGGKGRCVVQADQKAHHAAKAPTSQRESQQKKKSHKAQENKKGDAEQVHQKPQFLKNIKSREGKNTCYGLGRSYFQSTFRETKITLTS
jgi:hypothetical protein